MKKLNLQESIMSDLDAMAREHSDVEEFIQAALSDEYFNLTDDPDTREFLKVIFDGAHKDLDMKPTQVTEVLPKTADAGEYIADFEKSKAPQFKGKSKKKRREMAVAAFMAANKGKKMTKEEITEALVQILSEAKAFKVTSATGQTSLQSFGSDAEANDFKAKNTNIRAVQPLEEDDWKDANDESSMAKSELYSIAKYAIELMKMIEDGEQLDAWVQSKITKAADYVNSVKRYMEGEKALGADEDSTIAEGEYMWKDQPKDRYSSTLRNKEMLNQVGSALGELTDLAIEKGQYKPHPEKGVSRTYTTRGIVGQLIADQLRGFVDRYEEDLKGIKVLDKAGYATYEPVWKDKEPESIVGPDPRVAGSLDEKLDPVGHEDEDVDNDGKKNTKTDKYIKNRRVKIGAAIAQAKKK